MSKRAAYPEFMAEASDGHYARDVSIALSELIDDCTTQASNQSKTVKGTLTIKQEFAINERGEVDFSFDVAIKKPKRPRVKGRHYIDKDGGLTAVHPRQLSIGDALDAARRPGRVAEERAPRAPVERTPKAKATAMDVPEDDMSSTEEES